MRALALLALIATAAHAGDVPETRAELQEPGLLIRSVSQPCDHVVDWFVNAKGNTVVTCTDARDLVDSRYVIIKGDVLPLEM